MKTTLLPFAKLKNKSSFLVGFIFLAGFISQSCSSPDKNPENPYDYFPLEIGSYRIYQVYEETYSAGQKEPVIKMWFEKDEVGSVKKNTADIEAYTFSRSFSTSGTYNWQKIKEYSVQRFPDKIVENLDNEIVTLLLFPYDQHVEWNAYQYFNLNDDDPRGGFQSHYESINQPLTLDSLKFSKTIKVSERADTTFEAVYRLGYKHYASGVGLVYDEQTDFDYLQENGYFVGYKTIGSGVKRIRKIIAYGK